jgi:hypothetical protein
MSQRSATRRALTTLLTAAVLTASGASASPLGSPPRRARHNGRRRQPSSPTRLASLTARRARPAGSSPSRWYRHNPDAGTTEVAYALVHRADRAQPAADTVAVNPGGPGSAAIPLAGPFAGWLGDLTRVHDLLLMGAIQALSWPGGILASAETTGCGR